MTLKQCAIAMRERGMATTEKAICDGIESGAYPFGRIKSVGSTGRRSVEILETEFRAWLATPYIARKKPENPEKPDLITQYFADPINAAHFSKWCAEKLKEEEMYKTGRLTRPEGKVAE